MHNSFFLGILLVRKEKKNPKQNHKISIKTKRNKKNQSITFCCGDWRKKHGGEPSRARGRKKGYTARLPQGHSGEQPRKQITRGEKKRARRKKGWLGPKLKAAAKKERGLMFSAGENSEKPKSARHRQSPQAPQTTSAKCVQEPPRFQWHLLLFHCLLQSCLFKTKHTEKRSLETDWLCVHRYKHHTVCASRAALKTITKNWNHKIKWLSYEVLEK